MSMFVSPYYKNDQGEFERFQMYEVDYLEAKRKWPDRWSLEVPKKLAADHVPPSSMNEEPLESSGPPAVERAPVRPFPISPGELVTPAKKV